jgi:amidohydrolase
VKNSLKEKINEMRDWLVEIRRTIHMHPELGFEEVETSRLVSEWLERFGLQVKKGVAKTGVVGILRGKKPGKTVAVRADMDALPIEEANSVPYASKIKGKMHACGHDAHTAMLLGAAMILSEEAKDLPGNVVFLFQPAEETGQGAKEMVCEGGLDGVDGIFALHVDSTLPSGTLGYRSGPIMAAGDFFDVRISGKGGHAGGSRRDRFRDEG